MWQGKHEVHRFCWADLATVDDVRAAQFYAALFGWSTRQHVLADGRFDTLADSGTEFASLYRLSRDLVKSGVPSYWLPYVSTDDLDETLRSALALGGTVLVVPQAFAGFARVAIIGDPTGAPLGVWQNDSRHKALSGMFASDPDAKAGEVER
jgi:uncharacterized protein